MKEVKDLVAVIDDDSAARTSLEQMLRLRRYDARAFSSAEAALAWPDLLQAQCIISDVKMPGMDGEEFLREMKRRPFPPPIIMITGHGDIAMAVRCLKGGAYDFVVKPFEDEVLLAGVERAVERSALLRESRELRRRIEMFSPGEDGRYGLIGRSRLMQDVFLQLETFARSAAPVLIHGETGVGKELAARALHGLSPRRDHPFVPINAGALPENLLESELFGHTRGAYTGASSERDGKLVSASGGTLLLDEIESISARAQVQLLRVLEDGLVSALGSDTPRKVDIRLVATTKADLQEEVARGRMRGDFYHRIAVLTIHVPALRDRPEDIPLLTSQFLRQAADRNGIPIPKVTEDALSEMIRHGWPGNVRELKNTVERMVITSQRGEAGPFAPDESFGPARNLSLPGPPGLLRDEMEKTERAVIDAGLRKMRGEINATCDYLGISRRGLYERMKRYGLNKEDYRRNHRPPAEPEV